MSEKLETIEDYYQNVKLTNSDLFTPNDFEEGHSHFNISMRKYCNFRTPYNRRDYYKVSLIIGKGMFQYGTHQLYIDRPALYFPTPNVPYSWKCESSEQEGYFCLFNQEFLNEDHNFELFKRTSLFKEWSKPFVFLDDEQTATALVYFEQMYKINQSNYPHKTNSIKSHLAAILHMALELRVDDVEINENPANVRLYRLFDELLNKQFPLDSPAYPLQLKQASDYATQLNVHVNHLNSSIKSVTNKTTTQLIKDKIYNEAKNLLIFTDWDIAEVGYTLGFEQPSHFNNFFKKYGNVSPLKFRQLKL
ncbi:helix-turn-helix domain-containing protein [Algoriella sp.]|uniref:helix-turn-helix domain-containing protein n=1 Tax=Algoriella sp. TaxID=1872434 RepID=UPI001B047334|nr:helix-turn-helix domain-containing protein [Algoriella sp.]MBO6211672.1 helix-turn-helix transcriptional regulator [Algoriella sp.]